MIGPNAPRISSLFLLLTVVSGFVCLTPAVTYAESGDYVENFGPPLWSFQAPYSVDDMDISEDGSRLTFCDSSSVSLLDQDGNLLWTRDLDDPICGVATSSDGSYVVVGECTAYGHDVHLFDENGNELWRYDAQGWVGDVGISADGSYIAALGLKGLFIFDISGNPLSEPVGWSGSQLAITDNGEFVAATYGSKNRLYLYDREGRELWCYDEDVKAFSMTSDGRSIAVLVDDDLALLDGVGSVLWSLRPENKIYTTEISPEGSRIAAISWCSLYLFDEGGEELWSYQTDDCGQRKHLVSMAISQGGNYVAVCDSLGGIYLFDGEGALLMEYAAESPAKTMVFSSDGRYLGAGCKDGAVYLFGTGEVQSPEVSTTPSYADSAGEVVFDGVSSSSESEMLEPDVIEEEAIGDLYAESSEEETEITIAVANIKNRDDDEIYVTLLIDDDEMITEMPLSPRSQHVEPFVLSPGDHKFEIKWWDRDTGEVYYFNVTQSFVAGETIKVNLEIAEHRPPTARVSVKSDYGDEVLVNLWIDPDSVDSQTDSAKVDYGRSTLGEYELLDPGEHVFLLEWEDPATGEEYETETSMNIGPGETANVLLTITRPVEIAVYPTTLEMYEGDFGHVFVDVRNRGSKISRNIVVSLTASDPSIIEFEKTYRIGDIEPLDGGTWIVYVDATEVGECDLRLDITGDDLRDFSEKVAVSVIEAPEAIRMASDEAGNLKMETFEETPEQIEDAEDASLLRDYDTSAFSSVVTEPGIDIKFDAYGTVSGTRVAPGEKVIMKFYIKNTGSNGMWVMVIPLEPNLKYEWLGYAVVHVPNRWRLPIADEGVINPYKEFNTLYYEVKTGETAMKSIEGLAYVVPGETMETTLKCVPLEEGTLILGASIYHTNSEAKNQLTLTSESGTEYLIGYSSFENRYGHKDESFLVQNLKDFEEYFGIVHGRPWEITFPRWVKLETMKEEKVQREIEVREKPTYRSTSEVVSDIFSSFFG